MRQCETEGHRSCATPDDLAKAGSGPKNRRGGAPRGERPPDARTAWAGLRGDARASVRKRVHARLRHAMPCGPASLAREGVAIHPKRLSALCSLALREGKNWQASEVLW